MSLGGFTLVGLPDDTIAVAVFRIDGGNVTVSYTPAEDAIQAPRRQTAQVLRMLADHLEAEAEELEL